MSVVASTSEGGGRFHEPDCHLFARTKAENRTTLDSADEAEEGGFAPCRRCFPNRWSKARHGRRLELSEGGGQGAGSSPHARGVFEPEFLGPGGHNIVLAVDSHGSCIARVAIKDPSRRTQVIRALWSLLLAADPATKGRFLGVVE